MIGDVRDEDALADAAAEAQAVFHMAAQVAVTTSLVDPREDFDINVRGTLNLLDALRRRDEPAPLVFASTNKVYGDLADVALDTDERRLRAARSRHPRAPASARAGRSISTRPTAARRARRTSTCSITPAASACRPCVLRMSCIYGQRQMGTEDQGWVAHFLIRALEGEPITIYGDGCQVRDVLDVGDAVEAYHAAWRRIDAVQGRAFNLGGGPANAISLGS